MTLLGWLAYCFPLAHLILIAYTSVQFVQLPGVGSFAEMMAAIYLLPPLLFRLYSLKYPVRSGRWNLKGTRRSDWWVGHQLQMLYAAVPTFEALLRLIPGAYSAWLRLWGSKVGKRVYWTPHVELVDRHMLRIGDDVVFGHRVICTCHAVTKRTNGDLILLARWISIGSGVFIGALARIGPGVKIPDSKVIPYDAEYRFNYVE